MKEICLKTEIFEFPIQARCTVLDEGIHVLVTGGSRTHVGAVSYAFPDRELHTVQFPGHRDGTVSECWAERLCRRFRTPVVVDCGIHYDHVSRAQILEIIAASEKLLDQVVRSLS